MTDEIKALLPNLSAKRRELAEKLFNLPWFSESSPQIQETILTLPEDFNGYVEDLSNRPDEVGELDIVRLAKISRGNFLITSVFEVRSSLTNQVFTFEYVSWKTGNYTGMRGLIFLETEGHITHFIVGKKFKFPVYSEVEESIGGFFFKIEKGETVNLSKKIEEEICAHLGLKEIQFSKVVDLGRVYPDYGMTNNSSTIYAAVINIDNIPPEIAKDSFRTTHKKVNFETKIVHINEFPDYVKKINDNYFLAAVARLLVSNELSLEF